MPQARQTQISLSETPYYHCISRCVRRAFLCGYDCYSERDYEHRRTWIRDKLAKLVEVFAIDLCAYAIMSNHYHLVLRVQTEQVESWSDDEVLARWRQLFKGPELVRRYQLGETLSDVEFCQVMEVAAIWRARLTDISWFMRVLNEGVARQANREDGCRGRFWEGRFKSQALLDERAVLTCMAYVDLNPVRAGLAEAPEASDFTSVQQRSEEINSPQTEPAESGKEPTKPRLAPLFEAFHSDEDGKQSICGLRLIDYLELVDGSGRVLRDGKHGVIPRTTLPVLERLGINSDAWLHHMNYQSHRELPALGPAEALRKFARAIGQRWLWGLHACQGLYASH